MNFLKLTNDLLVVDEILKLVSSEKCGAVSIFVGTTRDNFEGRQVTNLEYEAYEPMAIKVMSKLCDDMREKWDQIHNIAIYHRLGTVPVMEASVVIAISSPHRVDSMAAVQYCIENLKALLDSEDKEQNTTKCHTITADPNTVEINVSSLEMRNRIEKYTERKREQINMNNIQDFIDRKEKSSLSMNPDHSTCARVDAILLKSKDSKSHLKVLRMRNEWGPQTKIDTKGFPKESTFNNDKSDLYTSTFGVEERILTVENKLNVAKPIPADIYSRLKKIEDKILELESISPEYSKFWFRNVSKNSESHDSESKLPVTKKQKFSSADVWKRIKELEEAS